MRNLNAKFIGIALEDADQVLLVVVAQMLSDVEPVTERSAEHSGTCRRPDEGKGLEFEIQRSSVDPLAQYDIDSKILHGCVEEFLDRLGQSVDLVDEQDRASLQVRQVGQDFFRGLEARAAGHFDMDAEFLGDAHRKRRLAESRWSIEQDVPERVFAFVGRIDRDF